MNNVLIMEGISHIDIGNIGLFALQNNGKDSGNLLRWNNNKFEEVINGVFKFQPLEDGVIYTTKENGALIYLDDGQSTVIEDKEINLNINYRNYNRNFVNYTKEFDDGTYKLYRYSIKEGIVELKKNNIICETSNYAIILTDRHLVSCFDKGSSTFSWEVDIRVLQENIQVANKSVRLNIREVIADQTQIYLPYEDGVIVCLKITNGFKLWQINNYSIGSIVVDNRYLYANDGNSLLIFNKNNSELVNIIVYDSIKPHMLINVPLFIDYKYLVLASINPPVVNLLNTEDLNTIVHIPIENSVNLINSKGQIRIFEDHLFVLSVDGILLIFNI